jgi:endonuclease/exonuclease/phosphatase family metal-dependent hydrolase
MTRLLSYNILVGGTERVEPLARMIETANPDVVGLVEAIDPSTVEELGRKLGMQHVMSGCAKHSEDWQVALLSRLPIVYTKTHIRPQAITKPVLEVCVEEENGERFTVFVTHLTASFNKGRGGDGIRRREVRELLKIMGEKRGTPHLIMGDFNAMAPGDTFSASTLLRYIVEIDKHHQHNPEVTQGHPFLNFVVPAPLRIFNPLLRLIPQSKLLCTLFDLAASVYAPRGSIELLKNGGYVDCFRQMNPDVPGFSCPAEAPAGRIDFIFASPELAASLTRCYIPTEGDNVRGEEASDHLPVVADFGIGVERQDIESSIRSAGKEITV